MWLLCKCLWKEKQGHIIRGMVNQSLKSAGCAKESSSRTNNHWTRNYRANGKFTREFMGTFWPPLQGLVAPRANGTSLASGKCFWPPLQGLGQLGLQLRRNYSAANSVDPRLKFVQQEQQQQQPSSGRVLTSFEFLVRVSCGFLLLVLGGFSGYFFIVDVVFQSTQEKRLYNAALAMITDNDQVRMKIGYPFVAYGQDVKPSDARRNIPWMEWTDKNGIEHICINFWIRGCNGKGLIMARMKKDQPQNQPVQLSSLALLVPPGEIIPLRRKRKIMCTGSCKRDTNSS